jgi:hypothetical protein
MKKDRILWKKWTEQIFVNITIPAMSIEDHRPDSWNGNLLSCPAVVGFFFCHHPKREFFPLFNHYH